MSEPAEEAPRRIVPLDERVLAMVSTIPQWDFKVVRQLFSNEHEKALYRAVGKLEEDGKIRYLGWKGRTKQYTTQGISSLPVLSLPGSISIDIRTMFPAIKDQYKDGRWVKLEELNDVLITIGQLFIVAQLDDKDLIENYRSLLLKFNDYKRSLDTIMGYIDTIRKHPIMSGDTKLFKSALTGEAPSNDEMNEFKVWLSKLLRERDWQ
jgi:hypothetical protein